MNHLARKRALTSAVNEHGVIIAQENQDYVIQTETGRVSAARAVGCLVEPMVDDLVLVSVGGNGQAYVLNVLERDAESKTTLSFDQDLLIRSDRGRISLSAKQGLNLIGEEEMGLISARLNIVAGQGDIQIERASFWGSLFRGQVQAVKLISDTLESFCQRLTSLTRHSYRQVDEMDQLKCGRLYYQADSLLQMQGKYAKLHAEEDVHIGGERINLG